ncbi:MAG: SCO family protein [Rhodothermales bacterium]
MRRLIFVLAGIALGFSLAVMFAYPRYSDRPPAVYGTYIDPPAPISDFTLRSGDAEVHKRQFEGRYTVVVFGYTYCPDVCPTTMRRLAQAVSLLGDAGDEVEVLLVSVDPERDDPVRAQAYARTFNPRFVGASGSPADIESVAGAFGIHHERSEATTGDDYLIDHTATITLLDPRGDAVLHWSFDTTPEQIAADLIVLAGR